MLAISLAISFSVMRDTAVSCALCMRVLWGEFHSLYAIGLCCCCCCCWGKGVRIGRYPGEVGESGGREYIVVVGLEKLDPPGVSSSLLQPRWWVLMDPSAPAAVEAVMAELRLVCPPMLGTLEKRFDASVVWGDKLSPTQ